MSKKLKMFLSATVVVVLTVVAYYAIATLSGGIEKLIENAFGGLVSALSMMGLLLGLGLFGWYTYWLAERRSTGKASSGLHAVISVVILIVAALVGINWVQWGWSLLWLFPLLIPTVGAAWAISAIAQNVYQDTASSGDDQGSSLDDLLP